jgi:hypothetical protein
MNMYWLPEDREALSLAQNYRDLLAIAKRVLSRTPHPIIQVCGPISTGGTGSIETNLKRFETAINALKARGLELFDQLPFEGPLQALTLRLEANKYPKRLLEEFYLPILESRLVDELYFLPDWQTSIGARWEHEQALRIGLKITYLEGGF